MAIFLFPFHVLPHKYCHYLEARGVSLEVIAILLLPVVIDNFVSTGVGHKMPTYLVKHYFGVYPWGRFWIRLTFKLVDWISRLPSLMWVGIIQSVEGLPRTKRLTVPYVRENNSCMTAFKLRHLLCLVFGLELKHELFLVLKSAILLTDTTLVLRHFDLDWINIIGSLRFLACLHSEYLGTCQPPKSCEPW